MTPSLGDFLRFAWNFAFRASALTVDIMNKSQRRRIRAGSP